jgi:hypothetical protein
MHPTRYTICALHGQIGKKLILFSLGHSEKLSELFRSFGRTFCNRLHQSELVPNEETI